MLVVLQNVFAKVVISFDQNSKLWQIVPDIPWFSLPVTWSLAAWQSCTMQGLLGMLSPPAAIGSMLWTQSGWVPTTESVGTCPGPAASEHPQTSGLQSLHQMLSYGRHSTTARTTNKNIWCKSMSVHCLKRYLALLCIELIHAEDFLLNSSM